jgi:hypothetical protein
MVAFQIAPEQRAKTERQVLQGGVVEHRLAFLQVGDQHVTDRPAGDAVPVDQLCRAELASGAERPDRRGSLRPEHAHRVQQLVEAHSLVLAHRPAVDGHRQLQAVADRDVPHPAALDREDGGGAAQRRGLHRSSRRGGIAERCQLGEATGVPGRRHHGDQVLRGPWGQHPLDAGTDHVGADEQEGADTQIARHRHPAARVQRA